MAVGARKPKKKASTKAAKTSKEPKSSKKSDQQKAEQEAVLNAISGIIEAGFLAAASDGELVDEELGAIAGLIDAIFDGQISDKEIQKILKSCFDAFESDGYEARMDTIAHKLPSAEARETAMQVVAGVILSDGEYDPDSEGEFYMDFAARLGLTTRNALAIWREVFEQYEE